MKSVSLCIVILFIGITAASAMQQDPIPFDQRSGRLLRMQQQQQSNKHQPQSSLQHLATLPEVFNVCNQAANPYAYQAINVGSNITTIVARKISQTGSLWVYGDGSVAGPVQVRIDMTGTGIPSSAGWTDGIAVPPGQWSRAIQFGDYGFHWNQTVSFTLSLVGPIGATYGGFGSYVSGWGAQSVCLCNELN